MDQHTQELIPHTLTLCEGLWVHFNFDFIGLKTMDVDAEGSGVGSPVTFDLRLYALRYAGTTKLERLKKISEDTQVPSLREKAYKLMVEEIVGNTYNLGLYQQVCATAQSAGMQDPVFVADKEWMGNTDNFVKSRTNEINQNLQVAKASVNKEDMRRAYMEKGKLLQKQGEIVEAGKIFARCRDFVSTAAQSTEISMSIAITGLDLGNYSLAYQWVNRIDPSISNAYKNKCRAILGIVLLNEGDFKGAARQFTDIDSGIIGTFREVISGEDVATYGALCTIATSSYTDVQTLVQSKRFRSLLELVPDLRLILLNYTPSNTGAMLQWMNSKKAELALDIHLKANVDKLVAGITDRLLLQYFKPYRSVTIQSMSENMGIPMNQLEENLASLIASKKLSARIDSESRTLHANVLNERELAFKKVHEVAQSHTASVKQSILRLSLVKNNFVIRNASGGAAAGTDTMDLDD